MTALTTENSSASSPPSAVMPAPTATTTTTDAPPPTTETTNTTNTTAQAAQPPAPTPAPTPTTTTTTNNPAPTQPPTRTHPHPPEPPLAPTPITPTIHASLFPDHPATPPMPHPGATPFLPKETGIPGTGPSSRCSSVNPNDTLPPTPNCGPAEPYPPQMRLRENLAPTRSTVPFPGPRMQGEQEVRPTTHLPVDDCVGRPTTMNVAVPASAGRAGEGPHPSYTAARRSAEVHPSGYRQDGGAMERPRYWGGGGDGVGEETLLGKLGRWVEGLNSRIVESGIAGDVKGKGREK